MTTTMETGARKSTTAKTAGTVSMLNFQTEDFMDNDNTTTICDRCADELPYDETQAGPVGTDWEPCQLCNQCYSEVVTDERN